MQAVDNNIKKGERGTGQRGPISSRFPFMILSSVHPRPIALPHDHAHSHALVRLRPHFFFLFFPFLFSLQCFPSILSASNTLQPLQQSGDPWFLPTTSILQINMQKERKKGRKSKGWRVHTTPVVCFASLSTNRRKQFSNKRNHLSPANNLVPRMEEGTVCRHVPIPRTAFRKPRFPFPHIVGYNEARTRIWESYKPRK